MGVQKAKCLGGLEVHGHLGGGSRTVRQIEERHRLAEKDKQLARRLAGEQGTGVMSQTTSAPPTPPRAAWRDAAWRVARPRGCRSPFAGWERSRARRGASPKVHTKAGFSSPRPGRLAPPACRFPRPQGQQACFHHRTGRVADRNTECGFSGHIRRERGNAAIAEISCTALRPFSLAWLALLGVSRQKARRSFPLPAE